MSQYTIIYKYGKCTRQLKIKRELKKFPSRSNGRWRKWLRNGFEWKVIKLLEDLSYILGCFNKRIIPLALVAIGYEMIIANSALRAVNKGLGLAIASGLSCR